jgi:PAS domain S-box-containing protein
LEERSEEIRIAVLEPRDGGGGASACLRRLGRGAQVDVAHAADALLELAARADLAVIDAAIGESAATSLAALRDEGPPVVVVDRSPSGDAAVLWFRRGAVDCVALEPTPEALPLAALEQIRRARAARRRGAALRRIRDLERYSEDVIQNMNSAVLVVDAQGRVVTCNPPAGQILGRPSQSLRGESALEWFPDAEGRGMVGRTLAEGIPFKGAESLFLRPDGSRIPLGLSCAPISGGEGAPRGAVATFQDLSEIRQLQQQVLQTEKMASIGQLAAGVAHEINNPMGFIHANLFQMAEYISDLRRVWTAVDALQKSVGQGEPTEIRLASQRLASLAQEVDVEFVLTDLAKAVRESQEGSERIRHIVQDLRDFSHQDTGERVLADVNQCLDSTASIVWPMMKHLVVLEKEYRELPAVPCYPMQLKQVFMNLLVNAYQAIEEKARQPGETGRIRLRTELAGDRVLVSVSDSGSGIAPEHVGRIFDPFFTTKKVGSGTGLGLSTSYSIVQRHGGTIEVESRRGVGTTFRVVLPAGDGDA